MTELTETQKTILIEAICRPSGTIYPMPQHLKGGAAKKVLDSLAAKGLIDKDGIITQPGLDQIDPDWTSIYATEMCAMAKKEADLAIIEAAMAINAEANTTALANNDDEDTFDYAANDAAMATFTAEREAKEAEESAAADAAQAAWIANENIKDAIAAAAFKADPANDDQIAAWEADDAARIAAGGMPDDDSTLLANDHTTSDEDQGDWTDEPDPEILAIANKHFPYFTQEEWPAIRNTIEEAYAWGFQDKTQQKPTPRLPKGDTKQSLVIKMLKRPEGATADQIAEATKWQNHTIRAFLSIAKRKLGLAITTQHTKVVGHNQQGSPSSYTVYFAATE